MPINAALNVANCACQGCPFWAGRQSVSVDPLQSQGKKWNG